MMRFGAALGAAAILTFAAGHASAAYQQYDARLTPGAVNPPSNGKGSGTVHMGFDTDTGDLDYTIEFNGLSGPATGGGFHGPAAKTANGPVVIPVSMAAASPIQGSVKLTQQQSSALNAGQLYLEIDTAANPAGELRGQIKRDY